MARQRAKPSILSSRFQVLVQPQKFKKNTKVLKSANLYFKLLGVLLAFPILTVAAYVRSSPLPLPTAGLVEA
jgi:Na+/phosphate symporter